MVYLKCCCTSFFATDGNVDHHKETKNVPDDISGFSRPSGHIYSDRSKCALIFLGRCIIRIIAKGLGNTYKNKASGVTYATYFFGKDAFGIIDPEGGALEMIIKSKEQAGGPLNQFSTIGYKFETNGATILYPERLLRVMSCSSFSATDEAN